MVRDTELYKAYLLGYNQAAARDETKTTYNDRVLQYVYEAGIMHWALGITKHEQEDIVSYILKKIKK